MFPLGLWVQGCCHEVSEGASGAYALACEYRYTLSGNNSMLTTLYSNFIADVDDALLFLIERDTSSQDKDEKFIIVIFFDVTRLCPLRAQSREFFIGLTSN